MIDRRYGTIRSKRLSDNLLTSPFQIDQRSFWEVLGYMSSYLEKINYYNIENEIEGNWKKLLEVDTLIYMVSIINEPTTDLSEMIQTYSTTKNDPQHDAKIILALLDWYEKVKKWNETLSNYGEKKLALKINNILADVLTYQKKDLTAHQKKLKSLIDENQSKENIEETVQLLTKAPPASRDEDEVNLDRIMHRFHEVIMHIQGFTKDYLKANILTTNDHTPNNALYLAFSILYKTLQDNINTLSRRHLDFYYKDILQEENRLGSPSKAIVSFDLLPVVTRSLIEKGTPLSAGKLFGSRTDIIFETVKPIVAYQLKLVEMETLMFNSSPYIKVGTNRPIISSVSRNELIVNGKDASSRDDWFVFGANKGSMQNTQIDEKKAAKLGFIIGSPALVLSEGYREIDLVFNLDDTSDSENESKDTSRSTFWKLLNEIKVNNKLPLDVVFSKVFDESLKISYTSTKGWTKFDGYTVDYNEAEDWFSIKLILQTIDPPVEIGKDIPEKLSWPSIRVELNEFAPVYLYSFLRGVKVDTIDINVKVNRIKDFVLYNNVGKMALGKPFDLFGPFANKGSYVMIGKSELFKKRITGLTLDMEWETVPQEFGGFDTYYEAYSNEITNDSFKVQFSVLNNSFWLPTNADQAEVHTLFNTTECLTPEGYQSEQLNTHSTIDLSKIAEMDLSPDFNLKDPLTHTVNTLNGFFKLTLVSPPGGFGTEVYEKEFIEVATFNAKNKQQLPVPNKPFIPKVSEMSMSYEASDTLYFKSDFSKEVAGGRNLGELFHITPYIIDDVIVDQTVRKDTLLPNFEKEGYLFLGIKGATSGTTIAIYFSFLRSSTSVNIVKSGLTWEYFQLPDWVDFKKGNIIRDDTNGFAQSGIVELVLPKVEGAERGYDENIIWIRVATQDDVEDFPKIKGVYLNAVEAICTSTDPHTIGVKVPAGSITKMDGKFPDIKSVVQPAESFDGVTSEFGDDLYTRVSERLRHKDRTIGIWDYEHLILEHFREVRVVKCTNLNEKLEQVAGKVKVVVLSARWSNSERHYFNKNMLNKMKNLLQKHSSPFIEIEVINPISEYLLVNAIVDFETDYTGGFYLNLLNEDISNFLSSISNIDDGVGGIGGRVVPTMVMNFAENLHYIKKVETLSIEHIVRRGPNDFTLDIHEGGEEIIASTPWSILAPVKQHYIQTSMTDQLYSKDVGVGLMEIGLDLILGNEENSDKKKKGRKKLVDSDTAKLPNDAIFVFKNKS